MKAVEINYIQVDENSYVPILFRTNDGITFHPAGLSDTEKYFNFLKEKENQNSKVEILTDEKHTFFQRDDESGLIFECRKQVIKLENGLSEKTGCVIVGVFKETTQKNSDMSINLINPSNLLSTKVYLKKLSERPGECQ